MFLLRTKTHNQPWTWLRYTGGSCKSMWSRLSLQLQTCKCLITYDKVTVFRNLSTFLHNYEHLGGSLGRRKKEAFVVSAAIRLLRRCFYHSKEFMWAKQLLIGLKVPKKCFSHPPKSVFSMEKVAHLLREQRIGHVDIQHTQIAGRSRRNQWVLATLLLCV